VATLGCENLRLLRPKGLAVTQKRRFTPVNGYKTPKFEEIIVDEKTANLV